MSITINLGCTIVPSSQTSNKPQLTLPYESRIKINEIWKKIVTRPVHFPAVVTFEPRLQTIWEEKPVARKIIRSALNVRAPAFVPITRTTSGDLAEMAKKCSEKANLFDALKETDENTPPVQNNQSTSHLLRRSSFSLEEIDRLNKV